MQATKTKGGEIAKSRAQLRGPEPNYTKLLGHSLSSFSPKPSFHTAYFLPSSACLKCLTSFRKSEVPEDLDWGAVSSQWEAGKTTS